MDPRIFVALTFETEVYEKFLAPAMEFTKTPSSLGYKYCFKSGDFGDEIRRRMLLMMSFKDDPENSLPGTWATIQERLRMHEGDIGGLSASDMADLHEQHLEEAGSGGWEKMIKHYAVWRKPRLLICNLRSPEYRQATAIYMCTEYGLDIGDVVAENAVAAAWHAPHVAGVVPDGRVFLPRYKFPSSPHTTPSYTPPTL
jgi:hypothetical protein